MKRISILGISSSPGKKGNTTQLVAGVLSGAQKEGAQTELIRLAEHNIEFCKGCFRCMSEGVCPIDDDVHGILEKLRSCDGFVIGSPTYGLAPNAIMKNLLDRIGMFNAYTSSLSGKYVVGVSTAGGIGERKVARKLTELVNGAFGCGEVTGTVSAKVGWGRVTDDERVMLRAEKIGGRLVEDIRTKRRYPLKNVPGRMLAALVVRRVMRNNVLEHRNNGMKAVYLELKRKGVVD